MYSEKITLLIKKIGDFFYFSRNRNLSNIKSKIISQFENQTGYTPSLSNPQTFNEKIQWLKIYYRNNLLTLCADKYRVRRYVKKKIGKKYLIKLIGAFNNVSEIDFNKLPKSFVLKTNHGSGQNIICKNKEELNIKEAKNKLTNWIKP